MKTKAFLIGTAAALALAPANAANFQGWYIGLEGGGNWIDETDIVGDASPPPWQMSFDTGWAALGTFGYAWHAWRAELELGYRANDLDTLDFGRGPLPVIGEFNEFSHMLNILYDLAASEKVGISIGAGAGGDYIMYEDDTFHSIPIHDTDWVFAWQAIASVNYHLNARTDIFLAYRYFTAREPYFSEIDGGESHSDAYDDVVKHTATIGMRFALAGAAEPEYVAPTPPPPPPPVAPKEFIIFFGHDKASLTAEALGVIREAAAAAKQFGAATIRVVGHADRSGSAKYNDALSLRRANVVGGALEGEGIPAAAISVSAKGEGEPMVPTADGVREPQNRRVNINM
jgi:outer membrane protein OmpA-like peptidoglycan-associated protein